MPYIEIKTKKTIYPGEVQKIINKGTVIAVLTTGTISSNAKQLLNKAQRAWAENVPETEFMESTSQEES